MRSDRRLRGQDDVVTATEIACFVYCPEQWRLEYGLGLEPGNRPALEAGARHHEDKAAAEQMAGGSITLGRFLVVVAALVLIVLLWWWL